MKESPTKEDERRETGREKRNGKLTFHDEVEVRIFPSKRS